jgi:hypothetical protein
MARASGKACALGPASSSHAGSMHRRSKLHVVGAVVLVAASACDTYACRWTDEPFPEPVQTFELDQRYETDDGAFEIVLHADGEWPPVAGTPTSLRIEWPEPDGDPPVAPMLFIDRPFVYDGDVVAPSAPVVEELSRGQWRIDELALTEAGIWALPMWLEQGDVDDSIELYVEVVDEEG